MRRNEQDALSNQRVRDIVPLRAPCVLKERYPLTEKSVKTVIDGRRAVGRVLAGEDRRMIAVVGPCSIHDPKAAIEYATRLRALSDELGDQLVIAMRVYFEKPRTRLGWRGLLLDPHLDGSYDIEEGLSQARSILRDVTSLGVPVGCEVLDPIVPQYIDDLICWAAIGARTIESQTHREMASGLSMPVGFKNGTDGSVETSIDAMHSSQETHSFIGINERGDTCVIHTTGNRQVHIILRGGKSGPNYHSWEVARVEEMLRRGGLPANIMVDCSHANSGKDHRRQHLVLEDVIAQRCGGRHAIKGFMLESNLVEGKQALTHDLSQLTYGQSVTDACVGWDETERLLRHAADELAKVE